MDAEFLHALVHDLKGPVSRVRMLSELLVRRVGADGEADILVRHIGTSVAAAESVLEGVRRYAEALALPFRGEELELAAALEGALLRMKGRLAAAGAVVDSGALPRIRGDLAQMALLFEELLANALRFRSAAPPAITIRAEREDPHWWLLSVADNGVGLGDADPTRIFQPLGKGHPCAGAGMGLAICSRIAALHGGEIGARPLSRGVEFRLRLPALHSAC